MQNIIYLFLKSSVNKKKKNQLKMEYNVSIVKCEGYNEEVVDKAVENALNLIGGIGSYIKKKDKVLLKANMLIARNPEEATTTHPLVLKAVIKQVKKAGGIPFVGDNPGMGDINKIAEITGIVKVCKETNAIFVDLSKTKEFKNPKGSLIKNFTLTDKFDNFDKIIDIPKLKTHTFTIITGAVKNLFGLIPGNLKKSFHLRMQDNINFSQMLLDLYMFVKPDLTIADGIIGMEGEGPSGGNPRKIGLILASNDSLALDNVFSKIINFKEEEIPLLMLAKKHGLSQAFLKNIGILGQKIEDVRINDFKKPGTVKSRVPKWFLHLLRKFLTAKPAVTAEKCTHCSSCFKVCPAKSINMVDGIPQFDYSKCIRCYCCQEVCPSRAIYLKKSYVLKVSRHFLKI